MHTRLRLSVQGGRLFPVPLEARIEGSTLNGRFLRMDRIEVGLSLE